MKKISSLVVFSMLLLTGSVFAAEMGKKTYEGSGEVVSVDSVYSRVTIKHAAIKGFVGGGGGETEFFVSSPVLLKNISNRDLVDFTLLDEKGDVRIEKITKTGEASAKEDNSPLGEAVQGVLSATGEVAKAVTTPVTPAHEVVSGAVGATTDTTASVLKDAPEVKQKF